MQPCSYNFKTGERQDPKIRSVNRAILELVKRATPSGPDEDRATLGRIYTKIPKASTTGVDVLR